jgi:hypothetical protein
MNTLTPIEPRANANSRAPLAYRLAVLTVALFCLPLMSQAQTTIIGVPTDELTDATPDGWDLAVTLVDPIAATGDAEGEVLGRVDTWNYYASDQKEPSEFKVTPLLLKNVDDVYTVVGIGETHEPEEPGPQEDVPFNLQEGTNEFIDW